MARFKDKPSADYLEGLRVLARLSPDDRHRCCAESQADDWEAWATKKFGTKKRGRGWRWLINKRDRWDQYGMPGDDHVECRSRDGVKSYISQPYGLDYAKLKAIVAICESEGLQVEIDARSWHFPASTLVLRYFKSPEQEEHKWIGI